jgi:ankyrin repeat protein
MGRELLPDVAHLILNCLPPQDVVPFAIAAAGAFAGQQDSLRSRVDRAVVAAVLHHLSRSICRAGEEKPEALLRSVRCINEAFPNAGLETPSSATQAARQCLSRIVMGKRRAEPRGREPNNWDLLEMLRATHAVMFPAWRGVGGPRRRGAPGLIAAAALLGTPETLAATSRAVDSATAAHDLLLTRRTLECATIGGAPAVVNAALGIELEAMRRSSDTNEIHVRRHRTSAALASACERGDLALAKVLLDHDSSLGVCFGECESEPEMCRTPLYSACRAGREEAVRMLMDRSALARAAVLHHHGFAPLIGACEGGHLDLARQLVATMRSAVATVVPERLYRPLISACQSGNVKLVQFLLDEGAALEHRMDFPTQPALVGACMCVHPSAVDVVTLLLNRGALAGVTGDDTIVHELWASVSRNRGPDSLAVRLAETLVRHGAAPPTKRSRFETTALLPACEALNLPMMQFWLDAGCDANEIQGVFLDKHPLLAVAGAYPCKSLLDAQTWIPPALRLLIAHGANASWSDNQGWSALHCICDLPFDLPEAADILISAGADVNVSYEGTPPLHFAVERGYPAIARTLIQAGARLGPQSNGTSLLFLASLSSSVSLAEILLQAGVDVNEPSQDPDENGLFTPLEYAFKAIESYRPWSLHKIQFIKTLIRNGAKFGKSGSLYKPPIPSLVDVEGDEEVVEMTKRLLLE